MSGKKTGFQFVLLSQCNYNLKRFHYLSILCFYSLQDTHKQTNLFLLYAFCYTSIMFYCMLFSALKKMKSSPLRDTCC